MRSALVLLSLFLYQPYTAAHHSVLPFDGNRPTTLHGTLRSVDWRNPHVYLEVVVPDAAGATTTWTIEAESPLLLERLGWTKAMLVPGKPVSILGAPSRDGKPILRCRTVALANSAALPCFPLNSD
jgi:Family of unknown function (DUF6152)